MSKDHRLLGCWKRILTEEISGILLFKIFAAFLWVVSLPALSLPGGGFHVTCVANEKWKLLGTACDLPPSLLLCHEICNDPEKGFSISQGSRGKSMWGRATLTCDRHIM